MAPEKLAPVHDRWCHAISFCRSASIFLASDEETEGLSSRPLHLAGRPDISDADIAAFFEPGLAAQGSSARDTKSKVATIQEWTKVYDPIHCIIEETVTRSSQPASTQRHIFKTLVALNPIVRKQNSAGGPALEDVVKEAAKIRRRRDEVRAEEQERTQREGAAGTHSEEAKNLAATVEDAADDTREGEQTDSNDGGVMLTPTESRSGAITAMLDAMGRPAQQVPILRLGHSGEEAAGMLDDEPDQGELTATMRAMVDSIEELTVRVDSLVQRLDVESEGLPLM